MASSVNKLTLGLSSAHRAVLISRSPSCGLNQGEEVERRAHFDRIRDGALLSDASDALQVGIARSEL
jgi:uncharacterized protein YbbK (DUF523 family)